MRGPVVRKRRHSPIRISVRRLVRSQAFRREKRSSSSGRRVPVLPKRQRNGVRHSQAGIARTRPRNGVRLHPTGSSSRRHRPPSRRLGHQAVAGVVRLRAGRGGDHCVDRIRQPTRGQLVRAPQFPRRGRRRTGSRREDRAPPARSAADLLTVTRHPAATRSARRGLPQCDTSVDTTLQSQQDEHRTARPNDQRDGHLTAPERASRRSGIGQGPTVRATNDRPAPPDQSRVPQSRFWSGRGGGPHRLPVGEH